MNFYPDRQKDSSLTKFCHISSFIKFCIITSFGNVLIDKHNVLIDKLY